ncbi:hypothetical protein GH714_021985 [Hevea brasiliensis]|uniref:Uncharacterized protein n=1 Tax=Hevea brasiliensis TaxID=3981 RepID=A0A6A6MXV2_HEVBR|nr:hypothetical protein GH714_021985 [Hevea brasiliensis]
MLEAAPKPEVIRRMVYRNLLWQRSGKKDWDLVNNSKYDCNKYSEQWEKRYDNQMHHEEEEEAVAHPEDEEVAQEEAVAHMEEEVAHQEEAHLEEYGKQAVADELNVLYGNSHAKGFGPEASSEGKSSLSCTVKKPKVVCIFVSQNENFDGTYALLAGYYDAYYKCVSTEFLNFLTFESLFLDF